MTVVAIITARGGSCGIPRKNILPLAGRPLIAHSIEAALQARSVNRVIVSTDDAEIAGISREHGAEVPFVRPAELARGDTAHMDVMLHAISWLGTHGTLPDAVMLLQPTSPLRNAGDIDGAISLMQASGCPAVVGLRPATSHPFLTYRVASDGLLAGFVDHGLRYPRRQDLPPAFTLNGALYLNRCDSLRQSRLFQPEGTRGWVMPHERSIDIDSLEDFTRAETLLRKRQITTDT